MMKNGVNSIVIVLLVPELFKILERFSFAFTANVRVKFYLVSAYILPVSHSYRESANKQGNKLE